MGGWVAYLLMPSMLICQAIPSSFCSRLVSAKARMPASFNPLSWRRESTAALSGKVERGREERSSIT